MEQIAFKFLGGQTTTYFQPKVIASVKDLSRHDMIYIYHHLQEGTNLKLKKTNVEGCYDVMFKGFKLGYVHLKRWIQNQKMEDIGVKIKYLTKQKYMPIKSMDIEISGVI